MKDLHHDNLKVISRSLTRPAT